MSDSDHRSANVEHFEGFADRYDRYRPVPPPVLVNLLTRYARVEHPSLVVDLGCGTGLSTRIWADRAAHVVGIEPGNDMRTVAEARTADPDIEYWPGYGDDTGLPDACADIVTVSQALHWMEPFSTLAEVARILRPGGVFAAIDADWPLTINWEVEQAELQFMERAQQAGQQAGYVPAVTKWHKDGHLSRMVESGHFRYVKEVALHHVEQGDAERVIGLALSQGHVAALLKMGLTEADLGVPEFQAAARRILGDDPHPWFISYRVRLGVK